MRYPKNSANLKSELGSARPELEATQTSNLTYGLCTHKSVLSHYFDIFSFYWTDQHLLRILRELAQVSYKQVPSTSSSSQSLFSTCNDRSQRLIHT